MGLQCVQAMLEVLVYTPLPSAMSAQPSLPHSWVDLSDPKPLSSCFSKGHHCQLFCSCSYLAIWFQYQQEDQTEVDRQSKKRSASSNQSATPPRLEVWLKGLTLWRLQPPVDQDRRPRVERPSPPQLWVSAIIWIGSGGRKKTSWSMPNFETRKEGRYESFT